MDYTYRLRLTFFAGCPNCTFDPCSVNTCPNFPNAQCVPDYCGGCNSRYYSNGTEVTDICSKLYPMQLVHCLY